MSRIIGLENVRRGRAAAAVVQVDERAVGFEGPGNLRPEGFVLGELARGAAAGGASRLRQSGESVCSKRGQARGSSQATDQGPSIEFH